jgi:hypothetical protein
VTIGVVETPRAEQQVGRLRNRQRKAYESFLDELEARGCAALGYRLTGGRPLEHLCVKHLVGQLRVVVAFESADVAWVLLVGPHDDRDLGIDVYTELYSLVGFEAPPAAKRTKPPCCDAGGAAPLLADEALELADRADKLRSRR